MNNVKQAEELVISQKTNAMQKIGSLGKMFFAIYGPDIIVYVKTFTPNNLWIFVSGWTGNGISLL